MSVVGIIAEYNPFHHGHAYHLQQAKQQCGTDQCICALSGPFVQRGEPAIVSKWVRTEMALRNGADLVIELPFCHAVQSAHCFAENAVRLLAATGIVTHLAFGSECGDLQQLNKMAAVLSDETVLFRQVLTDKLRTGLSYPHALSEALTTTLPFEINPGLMKNSNDILGIEYLQALNNYAPTIQPVPVTRHGQAHNDRSLTQNSSATAIREVLHHTHSAFSVQAAMPKTSCSLLERELSVGRGPVSWESFSQMLLYRLRTSTYPELQHIYTMSEGLEHRILRSAGHAESFTTLMTALKTKRYTHTRLQRVLLYCLLSFCSEDATVLKHCTPQYLRVLGMNQNGRNLLKQIKKVATIPLILRPAKYLPSNRLYENRNATNLERLLRYDLLASTIYQLAFTSTNTQTESEYTMTPIVIA